MKRTNFTSAKTAIRRNAVSAPVAYLAQHGAFVGRCINWGSGLAWLDTWIISSASEGDCEEYDPYYNPIRPVGIYDTIYCGYVANTLPPTYRAGLYMDILQFMNADSLAIIVVRSDKIAGEPFQDGVITAKGTFQKSYLKLELYKELREFFGAVTVERKGHYLIARCLR